MSNDQTQPNGTLIFYLHAGKLVDLAAISLLATLKHHKLTQMHRGNREIDFKSCEMDLISVKLPECITDILREFPDRIDKSIATWWKYHWEKVFFRETPSDDMITLFDQLVWLSNGSISFEQTARKLLDSDKLTNVYKFQIACTYCFIDDVNRLKGTLSPDEIHLATGSFCTDVDPFMEYWFCKIRHLTGLRDLTNANIDMFTQLIHPISRKNYNHWPVIEYFWNQSRDDEERLRKVQQIIRDGNRRTPVELIWHILPKLTSLQLDSLFLENGYEIMVYFAEEPNYVEYTMLIWKRVVNLIDNNNLNFILHYVTGIQKNRNYVDGLLREMWLCMSEQQKMFVANQRELEYVATWFERFEYNTPNYQLVFEVFMLWDSERRRQYWKANWTFFVIGQMNHRDKIEELMKIILGSYENIAVFKRTVMIDDKSIGTACEDLLSLGLFEELQKYFNYCTEDQDVIRNLKKQIITTMPKDRLFHVLCDCCANQSLDVQFEYFLRDIFTVDEIKNFHSDVLMASFEKMEKMLRDGFVREIEQCVKKYLSREVDLYTIKLHFMKYAYNLLYNVGEKIKIPQWVDLLSWCLNGDENLTERFKSSLQSQRAEVPVAEDVDMEQYSLYEWFCYYFLCE